MSKIKKWIFFKRCAGNSKEKVEHKDHKAKPRDLSTKHAIQKINYKLSLEVNALLGTISR